MMSGADKEGRQQVAKQGKRETMTGEAANDAGPRPRGGSCLSVITVSYNSGQVLRELLDSLEAGMQGIDTFEVVVADNDSADNSVDIALAHPIRPRVVRVGRNAGYAGGINSATATVRNDADLLILNPDVRLLPGAARILVERLADPSVGVAVPKILDEDGTLTWSQRREPSIATAWAEAILGGTLAARLGAGEKISDPALYDSDGPIAWAEGSVLAVAARARRLVGEWDESFFLYSEEVDYQRRVREAGFNIVYDPRSRVLHDGGESGTNPRLFELMTANKIQYYGRHNGALPTFLFRLGILLGEAARSWRGSVHRAGLRGALTPQRPALDVRAGRPG
jgi:N-acetylglucosaminyl-diphospho-decaprenol L-rhamnosyltransferase